MHLIRNHCNLNCLEHNAYKRSGHYIALFCKVVLAV